MRAHHGPQCPKDDPKPSDHDGPIADQSTNRKTIAMDGFSEGTGRTIDAWIATDRASLSFCVTRNLRAIGFPEIDRAHVGACAATREAQQARIFTFMSDVQATKTCPF